MGVVTSHSLLRNSTRHKQTRKLENVRIIFLCFLIKGYICDIFDDLVYLSTEMKGYVTKKFVETVEMVTLTPTASSHVPGERRHVRGRQFAAAPWPVLKREELNMNVHPLKRI